MSNSSSVSGDNNIILQNIDSSHINITIQDGLPEEVKETKKVLKTRLDTLIQTIDARIKPAPATNKETEDTAVSADIKMTLRALRANRCVLFLGPEIALAKPEAVESLHELKYKAMSDDDMSDVRYIAEDGFFEPHEDPMFEMDMNDYYKDVFPKENVVGKEILYHLAQLPFKLILSTSPDETMHEVFSFYDKDHRFLHFEGSGTSLADEKPEVQNPVIVNALGSAISNGGRFIYTDKDFYEYVTDAKFPSEIKKEIQQAVHLLFVGFDLRKWHTRLLLFMLDMHINNQKSNRLLLSHLPHADIEQFIKDQFQVTIIKHNYLQFVRELTALAQKNNIAIDLESFFLKKQLFKLKALADRVTDAKEKIPLNEIESELSAIEEKIQAHGG